ncbi:FirrV-1-A5 [Feldmannia irregularis virus a]|uniref:FirrV-1-A5 n=1 Tax=Feldmannia irregularis virus a TaxID=231992 RepID=Q6XM82_9PHYC|nr:FirrV-1-A5 [Feldmannia irregularis virus a]AAR26829.1 FirrV-1-A5 [Feldmannia irregularis virus a]
MSEFLRCRKSAAGLTTSEELLLSSVLTWYNQDADRVKELMQFIERNKCLSLRVIDWFVTNYSRNTPIMMERDGLPRDLYKDYQKNLSSYKKKYMDPFARRKRITILMFGQTERTSTIGQLNFFRWFLGSNIRQLLDERKQAVEHEMKYSIFNRIKSKKKDRTCSFTGRFRVSFL